jgi:hypothetical protein
MLTKLYIVSSLLQSSKYFHPFIYKQNFVYSFVFKFSVIFIFQVQAFTNYRGSLCCPSNHVTQNLKLTIHPVECQQNRCNIFSSGSVQKVDV